MPLMLRRSRVVVNAAAAPDNEVVDQISQDALAKRKRLDGFFAEVERVLVGQRPLVERMLIGLLTGGHLLLEGVPGLAKTLAVRTVAGTLHLTFSRIQFTPDLLPADLLGTQIFNPRTGEFSIKKGPVFANLILADEINRAPAKVQSALLEAMQEQQVTLGEHSYRLDRPFQVLATQNPIEQEGTYPLPEAQLDRFMFKVKLTYPSKADELVILDRMAGINANLAVNPVLSPADIIALQHTVDQVYVDIKIKNYVLDLVHATRRPGEFGLDLGPLVQFGASPRATLFLIRAAKGQAFLDGRGYVTPQDVKTVAPDVLRHRILVTYEAEAEELTAETIVERILAGIAAP
jgi:MoxR-like ATPase